ncbi:MAG: LPS export ABC transporter periplasmic protein LptC [Proteobacteria bacterium]|nr:LPS export ABC transporter periplasmic protein LptC [Pseudomonadota bacterium]
MKKLRNLIVLCVVGLALALSLVLLINWRRAAPYMKAIDIPQLKADLEVGNLFLTEEKEGKILWELEAKIAQSFEEGKRTLLEDLRVTLYNADGRVLTLRGDRGRIDEKTRDIEVEGGILVTSSDGLSLRTNSLQYQHERREIFTSAPVRIDGKGVEISGVGLLMDLASEKISILDRVKTLIHEAPLKSG